MANPIVELDTSYGVIRLELDAEKAPLTVANFLHYATTGHFDGLVFHRVIAGFMIQGGGLDTAMVERDTTAPIKNEAANGLRNRKGTVAMARTNKVDSATSQFFINVADNDFLDHRDDTPRNFGYAVFGRVTHGMEIVDRVQHVKTGRSGPHDDVPVDPVVINAAKVIAPGGAVAGG